MSDRDLEVRRVGQRVDPVSGEVYTREAYDPDKTQPKVNTTIHTLCRSSTINLWDELWIFRNLHCLLRVLSHRS